MRKYLVLTVMMLMVVISTFAQRPWKEYLIPGSLMMISGMVEGTNEALLFHYKYGFKNRFPNANNQYWDPSISWKNKYKNLDPSKGPAFPGSTDMLVAFTDGYHMMRLTKVMLDMGTISYCVNKNYREKTKHNIFNWKTVAQDFVVLSVFRTIGFHLTYSWMFQQSPEAFKLQ